MDLQPVVYHDGFVHLHLLIYLRSGAAGGKVQNAIRRKPENLGPVCSHHYLCAHVRVAHRDAARRETVQMVADFSRLVEDTWRSDADPIVVSNISINC